LKVACVVQKIHCIFNIKQCKMIIRYKQTSKDHLVWEPCIRCWSLIMFNNYNYRNCSFTCVMLLKITLYIFLSVVKSSRLPAKIAAYLVSIGWVLCFAFLYRWCFFNKIFQDWPLTLTTQPSNSKLSDNPDFWAVFHPFCSVWHCEKLHSWLW